LPDRYDSVNTYFLVLEERHKDAIRGFESKSGEQNDFLKDDSLEYAKLNLGVTYLLFSKENGKLIAFLTIGMGALKIPKKDTWRFHGRKLKEYPKEPEGFPTSFPALKIGQLATHKDEEGKGAGTLLIAFAIQKALEAQKHIGCAYLIADAKIDKVPWYEKRGFKTYIEKLGGKETVPMYMEL